MQDMPVLLVEDIWQAVQGPTTLVELAVEQKAANTSLIEHHFVFCALLHAILVFSLRSIKPLSLYDTKVVNSIERSVIDFTFPPCTASSYVTCHFIFSTRKVMCHFCFV